MLLVFLENGEVHIAMSCAEFTELWVTKEPVVGSVLKEFAKCQFSWTELPDNLKNSMSGKMVTLVLNR